MAYTIGDVSSCHLNPAVTSGLVLGGSHAAENLAPHWLVQGLGAVAAAWLLTAATAPT